MKKIIMLLITMMMLTVSGCSKKANMANPVMEYESLAEINDKLGTNLIDIKEYGNVENERISIIDDKIGEYSFVIDGYDLCLRASKELNEDISGVYVDGEPAFTDFSSLMSFAGNEEVKAFRLVTNDGCQYTVTSKSQSDPDDDLFLEYLGLIEDKIFVTGSKPEIAEMAGEYEDSYSMRAYATIFLYDINSPWLEMAWSSSVSEYDTWMFELKDEGNGKYSYESFSHFRITVDEDGEIEDIEEVEDSAPGYVEYKDGKIVMTGTGNEQLMNCVFEKAQ